jgi:hypothetical protein
MGMEAGRLPEGSLPKELLLRRHALPDARLAHQSKRSFIA